MYRNKFRAIVFMLLVLLFVPPAYSAHHLPDYPVRAASAYANKVAQGSLIVAVEPVEDPGQQKTYFDSRLNSTGILPVFLVIQNTSATDAYLFDKSGVGLGDAGEITGRGARKTATRLGSGGLVDLNLVIELTQARENLMKKEVRSRTLSPGASTYGFVYVPVPTNAARQKIHLQVPLTNAQSGETEVVNLFF